MDTASAIAAAAFIVIMICIAINIAHALRQPSNSTETR